MKKAYQKPTIDKKNCSELFDEVVGILQKYDPMGILSASDAYNEEAEAIISGLDLATSESEAIDLVHEEFIKWFSGEVLAGPRNKYEKLGAEIWLAWENDSRSKES